MTSERSKRRDFLSLVFMAKASCNSRSYRTHVNKFQNILDPFLAQLKQNIKKKIIFVVKGALLIIVWKNLKSVQIYKWTPD